MLLVMCAPLFLRERDGERLFPWQPLDPNNLVPQLSRKATASFASIRKSMNTAFSLKSTRLAALLAIGVLAGTTLLSSVSKILFSANWNGRWKITPPGSQGLGYFFALGGSLLGGVLADLFSARRVAGAATVAARHGLDRVCLAGTAVGEPVDDHRVRIRRAVLHRRDDRLVVRHFHGRQLAGDCRHAIHRLHGTAQSLPH